MRNFRHIASALMLLLAACQRQEVPPVPDVPGTPDLVEYTLQASVPDTRTVLDTDFATILWSAGEFISVLYGGGNYQFDGNNTETRTSASFTGMAPSGMDSYIALYPYNALASVSGGYVSTTLPASQTGKAGSFADGYLITADDANSTEISFNHICSGLRFQVSSDDIKSVSIQGNNGEKIAGDFRFSFTATDTPVAEAGSEEIVTLTAPNNGCFVAGQYYYIVILPTVFSKGFTLTTDNGSMTGILHFDSSVTFYSGKFKNITGNLNERTKWTQAYYGPENSYCISPGGSVSIDVSPKKITGLWQRSGLPATGADVPDNGAATILWGGSSISSASVSNGYLNVTASTTPGSSLIAIKNGGGTILWSYLIWVTANEPDASALGGSCYFQWGRKDPLQSNCSKVSNQGENGLSYSINNPAVFIEGGGNGSNWFTNTNTNAAHDSELWGESGAKTVWDPCPADYRVPSKEAYTSIQKSDLNGQFDELGYIGSKSFPYGYYYWTRTTDYTSDVRLLSYALQSDEESYVLVSTGLYTPYRFIAMPVRCVKD